MLFKAQYIPYQQTNSFSAIVNDYLLQHPSLQPFYALPPTKEGMAKAIAQKGLQNVDRKTLVDVLNRQYQDVATSAFVKQNIDALLSPNTFTICTAHQPNLFTGPLYFIYKILHAIKLSEDLQKDFPEQHFVPVFYMGSEDADLDELNHTYVQGKKYVWKTTQKGAVGRMHIDKALVQLINEMSGQISVLPHGNEVIEMLRACYRLGSNIQTATFEIVNKLFAKWGLVVLIADDADLKRQMIPVFEDDLFQQKPSQIVEDTCNQLAAHYNVQAYPREINLFYLKDDMRERIIQSGDEFVVNNSDIKFSAPALKEELHTNPERFSPNVILRGLFQETILPNIAFIGGGGELAYWLQLKGLFNHYGIPFPVQVLRNSFLIIDKNRQQLIEKLSLTHQQLFKKELDIINEVIELEGKKPQLNGELEQLEAVYDALKNTASGVDITLQKHVTSLKVKALKQLQELEKKMMRAERKKHHVFARQVHKLKETLFPGNGLQERKENFSSFYATWGSQFIDELYQASLGLQHQFTIITEQPTEA